MTWIAEERVIWCFHLASRARGGSLLLLLSRAQARLSRRPRHPDELAALQSLAAGTFWVGINDLEIEGTFVAETGGPPTFLPWKNGVPADVGDCVEATATTIDTDDCTGRRLFVCECEL